MVYQPRFYRQWPHSRDLVSFRVRVSESDLYIRAERDLSPRAEELLLKYRYQVESYIRGHPAFARSLVPLPPEGLAPSIIRAMCSAGLKAGVGPMAAVAGATAEFVGRGLLPESGTVIVENGGDVFVAGGTGRLVGLYAGKKLPPLFIRIAPEDLPCGICTSSGRLGPSLSLGRADSVTVIAGDTALADAAATACGNLVGSEDDIEAALDAALSVEGVRGAIVTVGKKIGLKGAVELSRP